MPNQSELALKRIYQHMADDELKQRIASGELTPDAVRIARDVLLQRLGGDGLETVPTSGHEAVLVMIYGQMHEDEIKQRLASDALIPLARTVAQAELKRRAARGEPARLRLREKVAQYRQDQHFADMPMSTLRLVAISIALMAITPYVSFDWTIIAWVTGLTLLCQVVGKSFPPLAQALGWMLLPAPLYAIGLVVYGALEDGNYGDGAALLEMAVALAVSAVPCFLGIQLLKGARHVGSWRDIEEASAKQRRAMMDRL